MTAHKTLHSLTLACVAAAACATVAVLLQGCAKYPGYVSSLPGPEIAIYKSRGPAPSFSGSPARSVANLGMDADEVWVLARGESTRAVADQDRPGAGALMAQMEGKEIPIPLKHTAVQASVTGYIGTVDVTQQFHNPYSGKIEAVYVFPLPHNAAVNEFVMTIGERRIRGLIRERQEAEQIYREAKRQGYVASLLTEERPNVFTQRIANIEPGKAIDVNIRYFHTLDYHDGWYEFVFPMVVGPRFNPAGSSGGIGAVARGAAGASGQPVEATYLRPGERTRHDISLDLSVDAGVEIEEFECKTHQVVAERTAPERVHVALAPTDTLPNKDFVLRYRVAGERIKSSLVTHRDERGGFFTLMLYPPQELAGLKRQSLELVFVLDCSGSMSGRPLQEAKAAVERGLHLLQPGDSFQLISFSMHASALGSRPLEAEQENIQRGLQYLQGLNGGGGTMMVEGIKAALDFPHDPQRLRFVCFLTDGYIGNETEILAEIQRRLGASRIFSFGIGSSVNRYLLDHMARAGRGAVAYLGPNDSAAAVMESFFTRISHPALTDLRLDWGGWQVADVFPGKLPDLFQGRPVILTGRFTGEPAGTVRISGSAGDQRLELPVVGAAEGAAHPALPVVWARAKIGELAAQSIYEPGTKWPGEIKRVALDYGLMSPFTAFIAVDSTRRTEGTEGTTVPVAVPVPEGVKYETTVQEN